jgi:hypothetical protein
VTASGGKPPYQWSITDGTFPPGVSLSTGGRATGTSSQSGKFDFTVHVVDSTGAAANLGSSVLVYAALTTAAYCAGQCSVEEGCVTVCGVFGGASGGLPPYQYTTTSGAAPPGMGLNGLALTGPFPAPGPVGAYSLTIVVTDQYGAQGTVPASWYVFPHIAFPGGAIGPPGPNCPWPGCTVQMPYSGGTPGGAVSVTIVSFQITSQCPFPPCGQPPSPTITGGNGVVTFTVPSPRGTPGYGTNGYTGTLVVILTDSSPCGPGNCNTGQVKISIIVSSG